MTLHMPRTERRGAYTDTDATTTTTAAAVVVVMTVAAAAWTLPWPLPCTLLCPYPSIAASALGVRVAGKAVIHTVAACPTAQTW